MTPPDAPTPEEVATALRGAPHRHIDAGHCEVACWSFGQGPDLLFVHGWPLHAATWRAYVPGLADAFTCHLIDLPGIGKTRWDADTRFGIHAHADTVRSVIDGLGLSEYALVAHDSGATITRLVAAHDPERIRALVMGDTELPHHRLPVFELGQKLAKLPGADWVTRKMFGSRLFLNNQSFGLAGCFHDLSFAEGDFHDWFVAPLTRDARLVKGQMNFARSVDWSFVDELPAIHARIEVPVLMIWGEDDQIFPLAGARQMVDEFAGPVELVELADARLFAHEEYAATFVEHMRPFLSEAFSA